MKKKVKFSARLVLNVFMWIGFSVLLVGVAVFSLTKFNVEFKSLMDEYITKDLLINDLRESIKEVNRNVCTVVLALDQGTRIKYSNRIEADWAKYGQAWGKLSKLTAGAQESNLRTQVDKYKQNIQKLNSQVVELDMTRNKHQEAVQLIVTQVEPETDKLIKTLELYNQLNIDTIEKAKAGTIGFNNNNLRLLVLLALISVIVGAFHTWVTVRSLNKPINRIIKGMNETSLQVWDTSNQLSETAQQLASGSAEQASAIEETSSIMEETSTMLQQNTANTKQAAQLSQQATETADRGNSEMEEMMSSIEEIKKSSDQIAKIIKVIDDIAFQTNILALNAAVEAARAGEYGMGFAVVAEEVRNLAHRSAQAAKDTTDIIEANIELSGKGVQVAGKVQKALDDIAKQSKKVSQLMEEIAIATQEQSEGVNQVYGAMNQIELTTQQNVANSEKSSTAAEELLNQVDNMKQMIRGLSLLINGTSIFLKEEMDKPGMIGATNLLKNPQEKGKKTKLVSPEDVIPLDKDSHYF